MNVRDRLAFDASVFCLTVAVLASTSFCVYTYTPCSWWSAELQSSLQRTLNIDNGWVLVPMNLLSMTVNPLILIAVVVFRLRQVSYARDTRAFVIVLLSSSVMCSVLKMSFAHPRPYWIDSLGVTKGDWTCYKEFANPSGHSLIGAVFYNYISHDIFNNTRRTLVGITFSLMLLSRFILGMHSIDQIIHGCLLGAATVLFYRSSLKTFLDQVERKTWKSAAFFTAVIAFPILVYSQRRSREEEVNAWTAEIAKKCQLTTAYIHPYSSFENRCLIDCACIAVVIALYYNQSNTTSTGRQITLLTVITAVSSVCALAFLLRETSSITNETACSLYLALLIALYSATRLALLTILNSRRRGRRGDSNNKEANDRGEYMNREEVEGFLQEVPRPSKEEEDPLFVDFSLI